MSKNSEKTKAEVNKPPTKTAGESKRPLDAGKRKLIKGSLAAGPIMFTLSSRPALAASCSMSGWHSANLSRPADCPGGGYSPGYWKNRGAELGWPSSRAGLPGYHAGPAGLTKEKNPEAEENAEYDKNIPKATMFGDICPNREHPGMTMLQVMQEQPSSAGNHVIAALLNAAYFGPESYGLSETQILDLYADYLLGEITRSDLRGFLDYTWRNH